MTLHLLAQAAPAQSPLGSPILLFVIMLVLMYFVMIRPQNKARKEQEARVAALKKGDRVITTAGIHAPVHHISEKTVTLKLGENTLVKFEKSAIQSVSKGSAAKAEKATDDAVEAEVIEEKAQ